ncbi:MAG: biotin--[acetyl-CoA-carboxylase] ligase [bacterium]
MGANHFGKYIYRLGTVSSTQDFMRQLFQSGSESGVIAIAQEQTLGRGRQRHSWDSQAGKGLWMTVLLTPQDSEDFWTWIPHWVGLVVHRAIVDLLDKKSRDQVKGIKLKWPNDIMAHDQKLGGILAECVRNGDSRLGILLGIGLNLIHQREDFPYYLQESAISLRELTGRFFSPDEALERVILALEQLYGFINPIEPERILRAWLPRAWGLNQSLRVTSGARIYEGVLITLGSKGELGIQIATGEVVYLANATKIERLSADDEQ